jgi:hypothetical protein
MVEADTSLTSGFLDSVTLINCAAIFLDVLYLTDDPNSQVLFPLLLKSFPLPSIDLLVYVPILVIWLIFDLVFVNSLSLFSDGISNSVSINFL